MRTFRTPSFFHSKFLGGSLLVCFIVFGHNGLAQDSTCNCVVRVALSQVGITEKTGRNDGEQIFNYLRSGGMAYPAKVPWKQRAWCGGFVTWVLTECDVKVFAKVKAPLATAYWVRGKEVKRLSIYNPLPGDIILFNFSGRKAGADHVEFCYAYDWNPRWPFFTTIGGNTSDPTRKGRDGVYLKPSRLKRQISYIYPLRSLTK